MPFDALIAPSQPRLLRDVLVDRGVIEIGAAHLEAHKQAQLRRYPASFWYRHRAVLPFVLLASIGGMATSSGLAHRMLDSTSPISGWITLAWMCVIASLIAVGVFRVRVASYWEERWVPVNWLADVGVPAPIAALARDLQAELPGSSLILGELKQEYAVLDPYLLLEHNGQTACLGIWDGDEVIACAART